MKKIYTADTLAVVLLDEAEEIRVVADALARYIGMAPTDEDRRTAVMLFGEISAPAPS